MTIAQYIKKLQGIQSNIQKASQKALKDSAFDTFNAISERIFKEGYNVNDQRHEYSKKPAIIGNIKGVKKIVPNNVKDLIEDSKFNNYLIELSKNKGVSKFKKASRKKDSTKVFAFQRIKGKSKKGYYGRIFPLGYYEYKKFVGRPNDFVNFKLTGGLENSFNNGFKKISDDEYHVRMSNDRANKIRARMDAKYGKVFGISQDERLFFLSRYKELMNFYSLK